MTNEEYAAKMTETLVGQDGITIHEFEGNPGKAPENIGEFVKAEMVGPNLLMTFSRELVLFFTPLGMLSIVGEKSDGGYPCKDICSNLYIGGKSFQEVLKAIDPG